MSVALKAGYRHLDGAFGAFAALMAYYAVCRGPANAQNSFALSQPIAMNKKLARASRTVVSPEIRSSSRPSCGAP